MPSSAPASKTECEERIHEILGGFLPEGHIESFMDHKSQAIEGRSPRQAMEEGRFEDAVIAAEAAASGDYQ